MASNSFCYGDKLDKSRSSTVRLDFEGKSCSISSSSSFTAPTKQLLTDRNISLPPFFQWIDIEGLFLSFGAPAFKFHRWKDGPILQRTLKGNCHWANRLISKVGKSSITCCPGSNTLSLSFLSNQPFCLHVSMAVFSLHLQYVIEEWILALGSLACPRCLWGHSGLLWPVFHTGVWKVSIQWMLGEPLCMKTTGKAANGPSPFHFLSQTFSMWISTSGCTSPQDHLSVSGREWS